MSSLQQAADARSPDIPQNTATGAVDADVQDLLGNSAVGSLLGSGLRELPLWLADRPNHAYTTPEPDIHPPDPETIDRNREATVS